jgi:hypothetical protein
MRSDIPVQNTVFGTTLYGKVTQRIERIERIGLPSVFKRSAHGHGHGHGIFIAQKVQSQSTAWSAKDDTTVSRSRVTVTGYLFKQRILKETASFSVNNQAQPSFTQRPGLVRPLSQRFWTWSKSLGSNGTYVYGNYQSSDTSSDVSFSAQEDVTMAFSFFFNRSACTSTQLSCTS